MRAAENFLKICRLTANRGAVLPLALVFMLLLALVATTVMQTAILQLHMSGNNQFLEEALLNAQAVASELSLDPENFSLQLGVGHSDCPVGIPGSNCDSAQLQVPASAAAPAGVALDYRVIRQEPLLHKGFPLRESQRRASSSRGFDAATFEISVRIDGSKNRLGSARVVQGIAVRVPDI